MKNTGILRIQAFGARQSSPIEGVLVTVSGNGFTAQRITDETGTAADLSIEAPSCALSLQEDNTIRPYAVVDLTAVKAGYRTVRIQGVQIFAGQVTLAQPEMIPKTEEDRDVVNPPIVIPEHSLFTGDGGSGPDPMENCVPRVLDRVIIPKNITVHLGRPAASARNVTVSFRDYIANVASSEVYPTWPEQALRANIHCQISLALNRIYTEWYPSKGYAFNITNSTSYDQYYVHGRTVFDVMVRITDDIFNTYLRKTGTVNPYYAEYCDGKSVTCPGLKQWGTVSLANQGRNALQILKYYYGNDIEIIRTSNIQSIPQSYPGSPIRQGDSGTAVFTLQRQLNRITKDYPFLGLLTVDGVFGARMAATVRAFQKQFNLTADGVVGRQTWYKISYIYVSVKDLAELTSEGEVSSGTLSDGTWGGTVLRIGSTGSAVEQLQFWLNTLAQYTSSIPSVTVDGVFGQGTYDAVIRFQKKNGLRADGVAGAATLADSPVFFKEDCFHRVYPSATGAHQVVVQKCAGVQNGSSKSLVVVDDRLYYKSRMGVCVYDGSLPQEIGGCFGTVLYANAAAGGVRGKYFISMEDAAHSWSLFVYDTRKGLWHREDSTHASEFARVGDELYFLENGTLRTVYGTAGTKDGPVGWMAETGIMTYGLVGKKYVSRINLRMQLPKGSSVDFWVQYDSDGVWRHCGHIEGRGLRTFLLPVRPARCDHLKFRLTGKGEMKLFSLARVLEGGSDA